SVEFFPAEVIFEMSIPGALRPEVKLPLRFVVLEHIVEQFIHGDFLYARPKKVPSAHGLHASLKEALRVCSLRASARFADVAAVRPGIAYPKIIGAWDPVDRAGAAWTLFIVAHGINPPRTSLKTLKWSSPSLWLLLLVSGIPRSTFSI